jgi:hypothetical protein
MQYGLDAVFGLKVGDRPADDRAIGAFLTDAFAERKPPVPVSLSYYGGGYRLEPENGTEILARYTMGEKGKEAPAISVRAYGRGKAVVIPRVMLWPDHLGKLNVNRPELRAFRLGRGQPDLNGFFFALVLRALLERLDALPAARLVRAPVSEEHLASQRRLMALAGIDDGDAARSEKIIRKSQCGLPYLSGDTVTMLKARYGVDPDAFAPVRVGLLEGAQGGRILAVINMSSLGRDAEEVVPAASFAADLETGEEFRVTEGRLKTPLVPYQARLLALF